MPDFKLKVVKTLDYKRPEIQKGYTDQTLHIDISNADIAIKPVEQKTKDLFVGGKGYDLWLLWNAVQADTRWDDMIPKTPFASHPGPWGALLSIRVPAKVLSPPSLR